MSSADKPKKSQPASPPSTPPAPKRSPKSNSAKSPDKVPPKQPEPQPAISKTDSKKLKSRKAPKSDPTLDVTAEVESTAEKSASSEGVSAKKRKKTPEKPKDFLQLELSPAPGFKPGKATSLFGSAKKKRSSRTRTQPAGGNAVAMSANQPPENIPLLDTEGTNLTAGGVGITAIAAPVAKSAADSEMSAKASIQKPVIATTPATAQLVEPISKTKPVASLSELPRHAPWIPDAHGNGTDDAPPPPPVEPFVLYVPPILLAGDQPENTQIEGDVAGFEQVGIPGRELTISVVAEAPPAGMKAEKSSSQPIPGTRGEPVGEPRLPSSVVGTGTSYDEAGGAVHRIPETPLSAASHPVAPTGEIWLHARDPHCLYCCWSYRADELAAYSGAIGGDWQLKIYSTDDFVQPKRTIRFPIGADHAFAEVEVPGVVYVAEIGLARWDGCWETHARSNRTPTPTVVTEYFQNGQLAPAYVAPGWVQVPAGAKAGPEIMKEVAHLPASFAEVPGEPFRFASPSRASQQATPPRWVEVPDDSTTGSPAPELAVKAWHLASLETRGGPFSADIITPVWSQVSAAPGAPRSVSVTGPGEESVESAPILPLALGMAAPGSMPPLKGETAREFWMRVNAELVIYGSTDPAASVWIAGQPVQLRPDGSFSFRFALPDGGYPLQVVARSADGVETRSAALDFSRATTYCGRVGVHPPEAIRLPPTAAAIAAGMQ